VECKAKDEVFAFIPEVQPIFAQAKIVQTEWNAKQMGHFLFSYKDNYRQLMDDSWKFVLKNLFAELPFNLFFY